MVHELPKMCRRGMAQRPIIALQLTCITTWWSSGCAKAASEVIQARLPVLARSRDRWGCAGAAARLGQASKDVQAMKASKVIQARERACEQSEAVCEQGDPGTWQCRSRDSLWRCTSTAFSPSFLPSPSRTSLDLVLRASFLWQMSFAHRSRGRPVRAHAREAAVSTSDAPLSPAIDRANVERRSRFVTVPRSPATRERDGEPASSECIDVVVSTARSTQRAERR